MNKLLPLFFLMVLTTVQAQKKSELIAQVRELNKELDSTKALVAEARRMQAASETKADAMEAQLKDLQTANTTLLQNLNSFAEVSRKNTTNAQKALENLGQRESQIKMISEVFTNNDSTAVQLVGKAKNVLGDVPQMGIGERFIAISYPLDSFFNDYKDAALNDKGKENVTMLAGFLANYPNYDIMVEGLTNTGEFDLLGAQANIVAIALKNEGVDINRLSSRAKDGGFKEGFTIRLQPKFDDFYSMVKDQLKN